MTSPLPVAIYARAPVPGRTKTRLIPALGAEGAAALAAAFLSDTLARCVAFEGLVVTVWTDGDPDDPALVRLAGEVPRVRQPAGDLGARMRATLDQQLGRFGRGLVLGSDVPTLPPAYLALATRALREADLVLGPSADGGYYLVGARGRVPPIFEGIRWSTAHVLADTLARAVRPVLLPPWYDVDTPVDLALLRAHLAVCPADAPATARALGL